MPRISVVIPTYNERENLGLLVPRVLGVAPEVRVIVVDDASPDGTGDVAESLAAETGRVSVLHRDAKRGLGTAYIAGFGRALAEGAEVVVSMDGDRSHDPVHLPDLLAALSSVDVAVGSRYLHGITVVNWPLRRIVLSQGANVYVRRLTGLDVTDCTSGYVAWRRGALESIDLGTVRSEGYAFLVELKYRARRRGLRFAEVPIIFVDRQHGRSKLSGSVVREAAVLPWRLAFDRVLGRLRFRRAVAGGGGGW